LAALSGMLFTLTFMYLSMTESIKKGMARLGADAMAVSSGWKEDTRGVLLCGGPTTDYISVDVLKELSGIDGVKSVAGQLFIVSARLECCAVADTMLIGFYPERDFTITPWLNEALSGPMADNEEIVGNNIISEPGWPIQFYGKLFTVAGKLEPTGLDYIDSSVFISMPGARAMIEGSAKYAEKELDIQSNEISAAMIAFEEGIDHAETAIRIEQEIPGIQVILARDMMKNARKSLFLPLKATLATGIIQWAVTLLLVGVLYSLSISERRKEIRLMMAIGAKRKTVLKMLLLEMLLLSGTGGIAGIVIGFSFLTTFQNLMRKAFDMQFVFLSPLGSILLLLTIVLFTLLSGTIATIYPIRKASVRFTSEAVNG